MRRVYQCMLTAIHIELLCLVVVHVCNFDVGSRWTLTQITVHVLLLLCCMCSDWGSLIVWLMLYCVPNHDSPFLIIFKRPPRRRRRWRRPQGGSRPVQPIENYQCRCMLQLLKGMHTQLFVSVRFYGFYLFINYHYWHASGQSPVYRYLLDQMSPHVD